MPRTPCAGFVAIVNVIGSAGTSGSEPVSVIVVRVFNTTVTVCALAVGVPAATFSVTVAVALVLGPLLTLNVKVSVPWKFAVGVYVTAPVEVLRPVRDPCTGELATEYVKGRGGLSGSTPESVILADVLCATAAV